MLLNGAPNDDDDRRPFFVGANGGDGEVITIIELKCKKVIVVLKDESGREEGKKPEEASNTRVVGDKMEKWMNQQATQQNIRFFP
jgi:hypothetical protein